MEVFVLKTLKRLRKEAPKKFKNLRDICDELIVALTEKEKANGNGNEGVDMDADKYFEPLEAACITKQPRLMEIGLDALHFLIEHGYMRGKSKITIYQDNTVAGVSSPKAVQRPLIDVIIETIAECSEEFDDEVQLKVVKVLLTAITSLHCEVHESSLLLAVRACFHIHLISKIPANKTSAKAALTQMLSVVNQRMEQYEKRNQQATLDNGSVAVSSGAEGSDSTKSPLTQPPALAAIPEENGAQEDGAGDGLAADSSSKNGGSSVVFASVYHKDSYLLFRALCKLSMKGLNDEQSSGAQNDAIALQNKILSLELILAILQNSGPAFRTGDKFIFAIRQYLCSSLLTNCTSQVAQITGLSLQIFVVVMQNFKESFKSELEVFVSTIFLRILESENSTYDHKCRVLEVFQNICRDPSALIELFINYDCDLEAINLFSRFVAGFAKIAKNPSLSAPSRVNVDFMASTSRRAQMEEQHIRTLGVEGLVIIIRSLEHSAGFGTVGSKLRINGTVDDLIREKKALADLEAAKSLQKGATEESGGHVDEDAAVAAEGHSPLPVATLNIVEVFDKKQKIQEEIETGILKFNLSAKKGLAYLASLGHIEMTPKGVASFFRQYQDRLDKTAVGDYLGREREYENGFCLKVLHEYVQSMDFADMAFDLAIRYFLGGFRLPGEAQKIDRLMEKFAERYYLQNRDSFASADMAFILAFSTIMLQTNLHNPAIRDDKRMTKEQFIKQNKGISSDGELPEEMLSEIYDRIAAEPISITADDKTAKKAKKEESNAFVVFQATTDRRKKDAFNTERKEMVRAGEAMIKLNSKRGSVFVRNSALSDEAYVRPMFEVVWPPVIGVLSQILETYDDPKLIDLCLTGFQHCILLACRLDFPIARNTFINALAKFTTLDTVREMREKNVLCIKLLLSVALSDGDHLEQSWTQILQTISQLARLQLLANGSHTDDVFFSDSASTTSSDQVSRYFRRGASSRSSAHEKSYDPFTKLFMGPSRAEAIRQVEEANAELIMRELDPVLVDRVYLNSVNLDGASVCHFVDSLCEVSLLEITTSSSMNSLRGKDSSTDSSTPRIFSMQKLVEVADFNMNSRSRLDWKNIWKQLAQHFSHVGLHENEPLAMYAIDSLKQLSIKFLQKEELSVFNFQKDFLKPFETIMLRSRSMVIKDLVLRCIDILIRACASNIHSGWRSIFVIFEVAAGQEANEIASIAFGIVEQLMNNQFELLIYDFVELMNCLVAFVSSTHTVLALKSLTYLACCADHLAEGRVTPAIEAQNMYPTAATSVHTTSSEGIADEESSVFRLWWPLLLGLSTAVADYRLQVRLKALDTLQSVLRKNGHLFSAQTWAVIFKGILFPMVDSAKTDHTVQPRSAWPTESPPASQNKQSWIGTMGSSTLNLCVELYQLFKDQCGLSAVLPDLISMLEGCISQDTESLAMIAVRVFRELMLSLGQEKGDHSAEVICARVTRVMLRNLCTYFGDAGSIALQDPQIPPGVVTALSECPLALRRKTKEISIGDSALFGQQQSGKGSTVSVLATAGAGSVVVTPYGAGSFVEMVDALPSLDIPVRGRVKLPWGYIYAPETARFVIYQERDQSVSNATTVTEQSWAQFISSVMTTMVVSLESVRLVGEILSLHCALFPLCLLETLLSALEVLHWHAVSFNSNIPLRLQLHQKGFMNKNRSVTNLSPTLPDLLEQEVQSVEQILKVLFRLNSGAQLVKDSASPQVQVTVRNWIERVSTLVLQRYVAHEEDLLRRHHDDDTSDEEEDNAADPTVLRLEAFARLRHDSYKTSVLIVLGGVLDMSPAQFDAEKGWVTPFLSRLVICDCLEVRLCVREIYRTFIHPLVLPPK